MNQPYDALVIGGGAAGMIAAGTAAERGLRVCLVEKNARPGRKLMITGKGRCNVTNDCSVQELIASTPSNGRFLYSAASAFPPREVMAFFEAQGLALKVERGNRVFYPADEFYLKAGRPIPEAAFYGEMAQLENGVGLVALLFQEFRDALAACEETPAGTRMTIATGVAAAPLMRMLIDEAGKKWDNLHVDVVAVRNVFFGETITVAGLVTGGDLIRQLKGRAAPVLLIPDAMLRHEGDRFLDDVLPGDVERELGVELRVVPVDGAALLRELLR